MSRLNRLTDNRLIQTLVDLERELLELKSRQVIGGNSLRTYLTTSNVSTPGGDYGLQTVQADITPATIVNVRFTSEAEFSFADLTFRVFVNGIELFPGDQNYPRVTVSQQLPSQPVAHEKRWMLSVFAPNAVTTYTFQFYVQSTSRGDFAL